MVAVAVMLLKCSGVAIVGSNVLSHFPIHFGPLNLKCFRFALYIILRHQRVQGKYDCCYLSTKLLSSFSFVIVIWPRRCWNIQRKMMAWLLWKTHTHAHTQSYSFWTVMGARPANTIQTKLFMSSFWWIIVCMEVGALNAGGVCGWCS